MKLVYFFMLIALGLSGTISAQVAINNTGELPANSAQLDIQSTTKGILIPSMTTAQRTAIADPANALIVFDNETSSFWHFDQSTSAWVEMKSSLNNHMINDSDQNTYVNTEQTTDDNKVTVFLNGVEKWRFNNNTLEPVNTNYSVIIGEFAGASLTTGGMNVLVGTAAGSSNTTGNNNVAMGLSSMWANTEGSQNTAIGAYSLNANTSGVYNTAVGINSLLSSTTGNNNCAIGSAALLSNTTGSNNIALGERSLNYNTTGDNLIAIGTKALYELSFSNGGNNFTSQNLAIGNYSLYRTNPISSESGICNIGIGDSAIFYNQTGYYNLAIGHSAIKTNNTGDYNTAIGHLTTVSAHNLNNVTVIGYGAHADGSNMVRLGNQSVTSIGGYAGWTQLVPAKNWVKGQENPTHIPGLAFVKKLKPVLYNSSQLIAGNHVSGVGFVPEDVLNATRELGIAFDGIDVPANKENGVYGIRYSAFTPFLVQAIQELEKENTLLSQRLEAQELLLKRLAQETEQLSQQVKVSK